jgi:hypothetical protein
VAVAYEDGVTAHNEVTVKQTMSAGPYKNESPPQDFLWRARGAADVSRYPDTPAVTEDDAIDVMDGGRTHNDPFACEKRQGGARCGCPLILHLNSGAPLLSSKEAEEI